MDYGALIKDAWRLTWRYRFLWVIGLLAGGTASIGGSGSGWRSEGLRETPMTGDADAVARAAVAWFESNLGLVATVAAGLAVLGLIFLVISLIAQGAMARATVDLAQGRTTSLGRAWSAGLHMFWRYVGLWLMLIGLAIGVAVLVAAAAALTFGLESVSGGAGILLGVVLFLPLTLLIIAAAVVASIVVAYAQRAIAADDVGPAAALREGWAVLRAHPGASLLVGVLSIVLSIGAGLAGVLALVVLVAPLGIVGAAVWAAAGLSAVTIGYAVLAGLVLLAALLLLAAVANTFFWNYWTLAYLRLGGPAHAQPLAA